MGSPQGRAEDTSHELPLLLLLQHLCDLARLLRAPRLIDARDAREQLLLLLEEEQLLVALALGPVGADAKGKLEGLRLADGGRGGGEGDAERRVALLLLHG